MYLIDRVCISKICFGGSKGRVNVPAMISHYRGRRALELVEGVGVADSEQGYDSDHGFILCVIESRWRAIR